MLFDCSQDLAVVPTTIAVELSGARDLGFRMCTGGGETAGIKRKKCVYNICKRRSILKDRHEKEV